MQLLLNRAYSAYKMRSLLRIESAYKCVNAVIIKSAYIWSSLCKSEHV